MQRVKQIMNYWDKLDCRIKYISTKPLTNYTYESSEHCGITVMVPAEGTSLYLGVVKVSRERKYSLWRAHRYVLGTS